jgi:putative ABC transport system ATP-binding protein
MIRIRDMAFRYGKNDFHLRVPDLTVATGETTAFIGPSGSGKTTLLNLIAGITSPNAGTIEVDEIDTTSLSESARRDFRISRIGLVFQEFELLDYLDILDNILLPYRINRSLRLDADVRDRAHKLAGAVGLDDKLSRHPGQLSQGERQRVAVCRALVSEPTLVLADEPTGNLDPVNAQLVLEMLFDLTRRSGATLLAVTHDHQILDRFQKTIDFAEFDSRGAEH